MTHKKKRTTTIKIQCTRPSMTASQPWKRKPCAEILSTRTKRMTHLRHWAMRKIPSFHRATTRNPFLPRMTRKKMIGSSHLPSQKSARCWTIVNLRCAMWRRLSSSRPVVVVEGGLPKLLVVPLVPRRSEKVQYPKLQPRRVDIHAPARRIVPVTANSTRPKSARFVTLDSGMRLYHIDRTIKNVL